MKRAAIILSSLFVVLVGLARTASASTTFWVETGSSGWYTGIYGYTPSKPYFRPSDYLFVYGQFGSTPCGPEHKLRFAVAGSSQSQYLSEITAWAPTTCWYRPVYNGPSSWSTIQNPMPGLYVVRYWDSFHGTLQEESAPFRISNADVWMNSSSFSASQTARVSWGNMPSGTQQWVSIAPAGAAPNAYVWWSYTGNATGGYFDVPMTGLGGSYVARAHPNNGYEVEWESNPFTVTQ